MKHKKAKWLSVLLAASLVFQSAGMTVRAESDTTSLNDLQIVSMNQLTELVVTDPLTDEIITDETDEAKETCEETQEDSKSEPTEETVISTEEPATEETPEEDSPAEESSAEEPSAEETPEEDSATHETSGEDSSSQEPTSNESTGEFPDETESAETEATETESITEAVSEEPLFPGLPEHYVLSDEQIEKKKTLAEYSGDIASLDTLAARQAYVENELVYLTDSEEDAQAVADAFGAELASYEVGVAVLRLPETRTVAQAVLAAADEDYILPAVWPNYYRELFVSADENFCDPDLYESSSHYQWEHEVVGDLWAWKAGFRGQGVKVGIIDTGIYNDHEEFAGRIAKHVSMEGDTITNATDDMHGHGTHVSGIVAANLDNALGGAGIAPQASLYVYGVSSTGSFTIAAEVRALNLAIADQVDVINISLGGAYFTDIENTVIQNAYNAGIAVFAAAGNEATNAKAYPASYDNVCSVASLQQNGQKSSFTNFNDAVDLAFPGSNIYSAFNLNRSGYVSKSGTSMACPVAAGVAAVILSGASELPELAGKTGSERVDALYKIMADNAIKSSSAGTGAGSTYLPKVFGLTTQSRAAVPAVPTFSLANKSTVNAEYTTLKISSSTTLGVDIYYSTNGKTPALKNGEVVNGTLYPEEGINIGGAKNVTVKAIAVNIATGKASKVVTATYTFAPAPDSLILNTSAKNLLPGGSLTMKATASPSYAVYKKIDWSVSPADQGVTVKNGKVTASRTATPGEYTITASALDSEGKILTSETLSVIVYESARVKSMVMKPKSYNGQVGEIVDLELDVTYAAGADNATIMWSSTNPSVATVTDGKVNLIAPGKADIKAYAMDGSNKTATCKVTVKASTAITSISLSGASKLAAGKSTTLKATLNASANAKNLEWSVDRVGEGVTVKNGKVTAGRTASGDYTISVYDKTNPEMRATHLVRIVGEAIQKLEVDKTMTLFTTSGNYYSPTSQSLHTVVTGGDSTAVVYSSNAPGVATVDSDGVVHAVASGKAKITATATDGSNKKAVCNVTVNVPMSSLIIVPPEDNNGYVCVGSSIKLTAQIGKTFGNPQNTKIKWSVPEEYRDIISVNNGTVKAKSLGKSATDDTNAVSAQVIAEAADGSGAKAVYWLTIIRKVVRFGVFLLPDTIKGGSVFCPIAFLDNDDMITLPGYVTTLSAPKGKNVGLDPDILITYYSSNFYGFLVTTDKATTSKIYTSSEEAKASDGFKVKISVKLPCCNKTASTSVTVIQTADGGIWYLK